METKKQRGENINSVEKKKQCKKITPSESRDATVFREGALCHFSVILFFGTLQIPPKGRTCQKISLPAPPPSCPPPQHRVSQFLMVFLVLLQKKCIKNSGGGKILQKGGFFQVWLQSSFPRYLVTK
jgi:hypothetical protein